MQDLLYTDFFRVAVAVPEVAVADCDKNADNIISLAKEACENHAGIVVFPELAITGYTCGDLFFNSHLIDESYKAIEKIASLSFGLDILIVIGAPIVRDNVLYNCAVSLYKGTVYAITPKRYIPNYGEFYEKRWWSSCDDYTYKYHAGIAGFTGSLVMKELLYSKLAENTILNYAGVNIGIEICEDLWAPIPPSTRLAMAGAEIILNLSASNDIVGKYSHLKKLIEMQSSRTIAGYAYSSAGYGESSTDLVFDGKAIIAENGKIIAKNKRWQHSQQLVIADIDLGAIRYERLRRKTFANCAANEIDEDYFIRYINDYYTPEYPELLRDVDPMPFVPADESARAELCDEVTNIQMAGLAKRLEATRCKNLVIGISGGLDSTLALLVAVATFDKLGLDRKGILGVTMPGFGTTDRTHDNAVSLMKSLGITHREISIVPAVKQHFKDIGHDPKVHDVTYENSQARQRTYILMDIANQVGGMVLGTGDLSELALGWATYNGDQMSMYGINASVPKTLVKHLVAWFENKLDKDSVNTLRDIIDTPISPELIPANEDGSIKQKTEDLVGPYELHDFFIYHTLRFGRSPKSIFLLARKAFNGKYDDKTILYWLRTFFRRFFNQQFKRSCMPDGPKVGSISLSPRGDWRMPSDASSESFLKEISELEAMI